MIILGIDPGSRRIGYGVIDKRRSDLILLKAGLLKISSQNDAGALLEIKNQINDIINEFNPGIMAVEKVYFSKNKKTALSVAQARGVIILVGSDRGLKIKELSPNEVKLGVTGYGRSDKIAVSKMVKIILKEPGLRVIDDVSDALAIAITASQNQIS